jgi:hypothetical protein
LIIGIILEDILKYSKYSKKIFLVVVKFSKFNNFLLLAIRKMKTTMVAMAKLKMKFFLASMSLFILRELLYI